MKKIVLKLDINDGKEKQKAMKVASSLPGIDSIGINVKEQKMTVVGSVDPVSIAMKLRKSCLTDILSVGPVKEEEPKKEEEAIEEETKEDKQKEEEEPKKEEEAIEEETKEDKQKEEEEEEEEADKEVPDDQQMAVELVNPYKIYYDPYNVTQCHYVPSAQESCTIL